MRWTKVLIPAVPRSVGLEADGAGVGVLISRPASSGAGPGGSVGMMSGLDGGRSGFWAIDSDLDEGMKAIAERGPFLRGPLQTRSGCVGALAALTHRPS